MVKKKLPRGVFMRPDSPGVFYIRWTDIDGQEKKLATTATNQTEAYNLVVEEKAKVRRQKMGLEPIPIQRSGRGTLWGLCSWWLESKWCSEQSREIERARLQKHVERTSLAKVLLSQNIEEMVAKYLDKIEKLGPKREVLNGASINRLRASLMSVFHAAKQPPKRWSGPNPLTDVPVRKVLKQKEQPTLMSEEIDPMLAGVMEEWEGFFATGIYLAFRKGEIAGLPKDRVDLERQAVQVAFSYTNDTTKGGHEDWLPIPTPLMPYFQKALKSPGPWMFPNLASDKTGMTMHTKLSRPEKRLRTALKRAGIVSGYKFSCRWCGHDRKKVRGPGRKQANAAPSPFRSARELLGYSQIAFAKVLGVTRQASISDFETGVREIPPEIWARVFALQPAPKIVATPSELKKFSKVFPDNTERRCPQCNKVLYVDGIPRLRKFHQLRHSTATILLRRGVAPHIVQKILRHAKLETTLGTYTHLDIEDLRAGVELIAAPAATVTRLEKTIPKPPQSLKTEKKAGPTGGDSR